VDKNWVNVDFMLLIDICLSILTNYSIISAPLNTFYHVYINSAEFHRLSPNSCSLCIT